MGRRHSPLKMHFLWAASTPLRLALTCKSTMALSLSENRLWLVWHVTNSWNMSAGANYITSICPPKLVKLSDCL